MISKRFNVSVIRDGMLGEVIPSELIINNDLTIEDISYSNGFNSEPTGGDLIHQNDPRYNQFLTILVCDGGSIVFDGLGNWNTYDLPDIVTHI